MTLEQITELLKWITIINIGILTFSSVVIMLIKDYIGKMHGKMFGIKPENVAIAVYCYLGVFKVIIITFNLVPYIALCIIS